MPNSLQSSDIGSPASLRATNCILSSMTEHSFQGISPSLLQEEVLPMCSVQCVTYVSGRSPAWLAPNEKAKSCAETAKSHGKTAKDYCVYRNERGWIHRAA